jgi:hypothetical protein
MSGCQPAGGAVFRLSLNTNWRKQTHPVGYPGMDAAFGDLSVAVHPPDAGFFSPGATADTENRQMVYTGGANSDVTPHLMTMRTSCPNPGAHCVVCCARLLAFMHTIPVSRPHDRFSPSTALYSWHVAGAEGNNSMHAAVWLTHVPRAHAGLCFSTHHLNITEATTALSVMSFIMPSSDWFIGLHAFPLCQGGSWISSARVPLLPYDLGTHDGRSFRYSNVLSDPPQAVSRLFGLGDSPFRDPQLCVPVCSCQCTPMRSSTTAQASPSPLRALQA